MDTVIIYISYDAYEYVNYYHLICNGKKMIEYCPEEKIATIFEKIKENTNNPELYIVQGADSTIWNFEEEFAENEIELNNHDKGKNTEIFEIITNCDLSSDDNDINIVFHGKALFKKDYSCTEETLLQAEEILKNGGEEMTELARIIKQKYERMKRND